MQFMQVITSLLLAAFAGYIGAWYFGALEGNFALLLFLATVVTGVYWLGERFYFLPQRRKAAQALEDAAVQRRAELDRMGIQKVDVDAQEAKSRILMQPWWLDWTAGLFPVIAAVAAGDQCALGIQQRQAIQRAGAQPALRQRVALLGRRQRPIHPPVFSASSTARSSAGARWRRPPT